MGNPAHGSCKPVELGNAPAGDWIHVHVEHLAAPQGSHRQGFGKSVRETNPRTEPYRHAVAEACEDVLGDDWTPLDGGLEAVFFFHMMPPPKSDPHRAFPIGAPDLDKLIRSTCDGMTRGRIWKDDARLVRVLAEKLHSATPEETGVDIYVRRMAL